jgi:transposase
MAATEKQLEKIAAATKRKKRPLRGKQNIGLRAGKIVNRYKMGKHFQLRIEEDSFHYERKTANIEREQNLDGIYVIRTSVKKQALSSQEVVASYKSLSGVERAFRSLKTVDLQVRPIHHRLPDRVRAHILLCVLAYYVEWHMRQLLAPILFDDDDKPQARAARVSIVAPAQRSATAEVKALTKQTADGIKVHSFQTLLGDLATIVKNRIQPADKSIAAFDMLTQPTAIQQRAFDLLHVSLRP